MIEQDLRSTIANVLVQLDLCSHVSAVNLDPEAKETSSEGRGGKRPPGGADERLPRSATLQERIDHQAFALKSADHFRRRLAKAHSQRTLQAILQDAEAALAAFKRRPPESKEPEYGTPQWKRWIGESKESYGALARRFNCSPSYIQQIKKQYRPVVA